MDLEVVDYLTDIIDHTWYSVIIRRETENAVLFEFLTCRNPDRPTRFWAAKSIIDLVIYRKNGNLMVLLPYWFDFGKSIDRRHYKTMKGI